MNSIDSIYQNMQTNRPKATFVHDFKFTRHHNHIYGEGQFQYDTLWKEKYLCIFSELTIVARGADNKNQSALENGYRLDGPGVKFVTTASLASLSGLTKFNQVKKAVKREILRSDFTIVRLPSLQGLVACSVLRKTKTPYVIEVVGSAFGSLWYHDALIGKLMAPIIHLITRYYIGKATNVIYVTDSFLQKQYPNQRNTLACSDVNIGKIDQNILRKKTMRINKYSAETVYRLGLVGSYDVMYKGHDTAIRAISKLPKNIAVELHFLGHGDRSQWINFAKLHGVEHKVFFDTPLSSGAQMFEWIDNIDLLLVPSRTEGMPRVLIEAMSRGCVIIGTSVGEIPSLLEHDNVIPNGDYLKLSSRIAQLIQAPSLMAASAEINFEYAKKFTYRLLAKKRLAYMISVTLKEKGKSK